VAELPGLRDQLHHDRRNLAGPSRHLPAPALWRTAARDPKLLRPEVTEQEIRAITNRAPPNIGLYVGATVLAIFHPNAAAGLYLVIALVTVARARGDTPEPGTSQAA
jgi:hypothetical protein